MLEVLLFSCWKYFRLYNSIIFIDQQAQLANFLIEKLKMLATSPIYSLSLIIIKEMVIKNKFIMFIDVGII